MNKGTNHYMTHVDPDMVDIGVCNAMIQTIKTTGGTVMVKCGLPSQGHATGLRCGYHYVEELMINFVADMHSDAAEHDEHYRTTGEDMDRTNQLFAVHLAEQMTDLEAVMTKLRDMAVTQILAHNSRAMHTPHTPHTPHDA